MSKCVLRMHASRHQDTNLAPDSSHQPSFGTAQDRMGMGNGCKCGLPPCFMLLWLSTISCMIGS